MFSYEKRIQAVELLIKYDLQYTKVIQKLGYPSISGLRKWYKEYQNDHALHPKRRPRKPKYSEEQKRAALRYYEEHGKNASNTIKALGYPSRHYFSLWLDEAYPDRKRLYTRDRPVVKYTLEEKKQAVIEACTSQKPLTRVAEKLDVSRPSLYKWKKELLGQEYTVPKKKTLAEEVADLKESCSRLEETVAKLKEETESLEAERFRLQLEVDLLTNAEIILKKEKGVSLQELTNREKAVLIDTLRNNYRLKTLLNALKISKSSYCYQEKAMGRGDKYRQLKADVKKIFDENAERYGYRRIWYSLKNEGRKVSEKVIRRLMKEQNLHVPFVKMNKYSSYEGEISPAVDNLVKKNFHADKPNKLWLTDITEFHIPAGKVYLSPMIDCFDGLPVAWTIGTSPNAELVNTMLKDGIAALHEGERPIVHTDRGAHYRWPEWIRIMDDNHLTRSMSKKGYSPDNAACEGFHGRLKNEFFYGKNWRGIGLDAFMQKLDEYLKWYSEKRIKVTLGGKSPLEYRRSLGIVG